MPPSSPQSVIRRLALEEGFDAVSFTAPELPENDRTGLDEFLEQKHHGKMDWMADKRELRHSPKAIWPDVRSIIMLGMNYGPEGDPLEILTQQDKGAISVYAQGRDYHNVIKGKLKQLCLKIGSKLGGEYRVYVDTAPVMEKPLAARSSLGWQGKHTCLVSRKFGSWLFLGEIFTSLEIPPEEAEANHCGSCSRCLDICPTDAFPEPGKLDARRCISYLTIEYPGHIPEEFRTPMGNRIYGCDDCLAVCPWNKFAQTAREQKLHPKPQLQAPDLAELARLDDAAFRQFFAGTPVKRTGRDRFIRNVMIAIGNSGNLNFLPVIRERLSDASPLVRAMAVWALGELADKEEYCELYDNYGKKETDKTVRQEWRNFNG